MEILDEPAIAAANPFDRIRARRLGRWIFRLIVAVFAVMIFAAVVTPAIDLESPESEVFVGCIAALPFVAWIWEARRRSGLSLSRLLALGSAGQPWRRALGLLPALLLSGIGLGWLSVALLSVVAPEYALETWNLTYLYTAEQSPHYLALNAVQAILIAIVVPLLEEVVFRGLLLHRWLHKYSVRTGVWASSLVFGLLHFESAVGATLFGVMLCRLYLQTGSLAGPIACHVLYNSVAVLLMAFPEVGWDSTPLESPEAIRDSVWIGVAITLVSVPLVLRAWRGTRFDEHAPAPYFRSKFVE